MQQEHNWFEGAFLAKLSADPIEAAKDIVVRYAQWRKSIGSPPIWPENVVRQVVQWLAFLRSFSENYRIEMPVPKPSREPKIDLRAVGSAIEALSMMVRDHERSQVYLDTYSLCSTSLPGSFSYEFLDSDFTRLQELINELRTLATESDELEEDHRRRLLKRIERLQTELNKRMSSLEVFWGMLGEAGVVLGKFGEDLKPLTDRIREMLEIVYGTEMRANALPPGRERPMIDVLREVSEKADVPPPD